MPNAVTVSSETTPADRTYFCHHEATRSEAIRRLVELGLTVNVTAKQPSPSRAARAKELATNTIEKIIDPSAPPEERAQRRRRLTKGPSEFLEARVDLSKARGK